MSSDLRAQKKIKGTFMKKKMHTKATPFHFKLSDIQSHDTFRPATDLTENLNECEKKSEYTEKNLNLTTKIAFLHRNLYQIQSQKYLIFVPGCLNFTKFHEKNLN